MSNKLRNHKNYLRIFCKQDKIYGKFITSKTKEELGICDSVLNMLRKLPWNCFIVLTFHKPRFRKSDWTLHRNRNTTNLLTLGVSYRIKDLELLILATFGLRAMTKPLSVVTKQGGFPERWWRHRLTQLKDVFVSTFTRQTHRKRWQSSF